LDDTRIDTSDNLAIDDPQEGNRVPFPIHRPEQRSRLPIRSKPYFQSLRTGLHLGYRKNKGSSRWVVRWRTGDGYRMQTVVEAIPDDPGAASSERVRSFEEMARSVMAKGIYFCSFCGKSSKVVKKLVAGPNVFICDECVTLCTYYMDHEHEAGHVLLLDDDGKAVLDAKGRPQFVPAGENDNA
jgi:hypothetical protein